MTLKTLSISNFRNFGNTLEVALSDNFNLLYGINGSGKTNFLEAIYYLGTGRSFRCHLHSRLINYDTNVFVLHGIAKHQANDITFGINKSISGEQEIHLHGNKISSITELARFLPLQILNQDSYQILTSGPKYRRQVIDWGVFHVEQGNISLWKKIEHILQQRNAALKKNIPLAQLKFWDKELSLASSELHLARERYFLKLLPILQEYLKKLFNDIEININYYAGWDTTYDLEEILLKTWLHDSQIGFTSSGPQKADLQIRINSIPIQDVLSRGQQKLFLLAIYIAQAIILNKTTNLRPIFLIDDLTAELDLEKQLLAITILTEINAQFFITGIDLNHLLNTLMSKNINNIKMFHVKHGNIKNETMPYDNTTAT